MLIPSPMCTIYTGITFECLYCINCAYFPVDCCMACSLWRLCAGNCHSGENEYSCFSVMSVWGWIAFAPYFPLGCCRCCCCFTALLPTQTAKSLVILCVGCRGVITTAVLHTSFFRTSVCFCNIGCMLNPTCHTYRRGWHLHFPTHVSVGPL